MQRDGVCGAAAKGEADAADRQEHTPLAQFQPSQAELPPPKSSLPEVPLPVWSEGAIPNDFVLRFASAAALEDFLRRAGNADIRVVGRIDRLRALRVRGLAAAVAALANGSADLAANFPVQLPRQPGAADFSTDGLVPFANGALAFLGVPLDGSQLDWGSGVTIAVLDTGVQRHADLADLRLRVMDLLGNQDSSLNSHGTAVAGLIGSTSEMAPGIAPGSDILSIRVLDGDGRGDVFTLAMGIIEAVDQGAQIINMSLGSYGQNDILREAVVYASEAGVLMIASVGNEGGPNPTFPAAYPEVIGVAAIDAAGKHAPFSNYGVGVDIAAPGFQLHALWDDDLYVTFDGTSAATPLVAGMAAELVASGAARDAQHAGELILELANDAGAPGFDAQLGAGVLSAQRLLQAGQRGIYDIAIADFYPDMDAGTAGSFPLYVSFQNRGTEPIPATTVSLEINGKPYTHRFAPMAVGTVDSLQIPVAMAPLDAGSSFSVTAEVRLPERLTDIRPENNRGRITLSRQPDR